ncbi:MAG: rRNA maturation RNase YbeY [Actinobacteria bacterium]|nr:rRNA maturation RNase YbeY [Actinomycetota bacterium]
MRIEVQNDVGLGKRAVRELKKACRRALREEGARRDSILSMALLGEEGMAELNRRSTGREGATDVLAFPMEEECAEGYILGDLAICPAVVFASRRDYGVEEGGELAYVAVHGVLHLLGYDDEDDKGAVLMERRQREILRLSGEERCTRG